MVGLNGKTKTAKLLMRFIENNTHKYQNYTVREVNRFQRQKS